MEHCHSLFRTALLVLALAATPLLNAPAQQSDSADKSPKASGPKSAEEIKAILSKAIQAVHADATVSGFVQKETVGSNDIYSVQCTVKGTNLVAEISDDGTLLNTEQPGDIRQFPPAAEGALRGAITAMGIRENGIKLRCIYAEIQKDPSGASTIVQLASPRMIYGADVQNNRAQKGKYGFYADGTLAEKPSWAQ